MQGLRGLAGQAEAAGGQARPDEGREDPLSVITARSVKSLSGNPVVMGFACENTESCAIIMKSDTYLP